MLYPGVCTEGGSYLGQALLGAFAVVAFLPAIFEMLKNQIIGELTVFHPKFKNNWNSAV